MKIAQEDDNHFLRLSNNNKRESAFLSSSFALKPIWKAVRVRVRLRRKNLKSREISLGAELQITVEYSEQINRIGSFRLVETR